MPLNKIHSPSPNPKVTVQICTIVCCSNTTKSTSTKSHTCKVISTECVMSFQPHFQVSSQAHSTNQLKFNLRILSNIHFYTNQVKDMRLRMSPRVTHSRWTLTMHLPTVLQLKRTRKTIVKIRATI